MVKIKGWEKTLDAKNEIWYEYKSSSSYYNNIRLVIQTRHDIKPKYDVRIIIDNYYTGNGKFFNTKKKHYNTLTNI